MAGLYGIKDIRHISAAYHNRYNKGLKHPDRIMNEHDFVYLLNGRWEIWQDDTAHHLIPGDVIALHAGLHHYGIQPCSDYTETIYIHAERLDCDRYLKNGMSAESLDALPLDTVIHCQGVSEIESLFHEIAFLHSSPSLCQAQEISLMFHFLLCRLFCCSQNAVKLDNPLVKNCVSTINANPQKFFTAEELSDRLFVSCRTLRNQFKTVYGQTLYHFQRENKLQLSLNYLTNYPNMKLYDIAINLGFYDEFHFSKVFKKRYGCPPSVYKELIRNKN